MILGYEKEGSYKCTCCEATFPRKYLLEDHVKTLHKEIFSNCFQKCGLCEKAFNETKFLANHIVELHEGKNAEYKCPVNEGVGALGIHSRLKPTF